MEKRRLSFWEIWNMSFGFLGIQMSFDLQNANTSRILKIFGADVRELSWFWIMASLTGLIVQPIALGSASKNSVEILNKVNLLEKFDAIVDGNAVTKAKPDPEVFLEAAKAIQIKPDDCIVFEDSVAGIQAANSANMISIGIGDASVLNEADFVFRDFTEMSLDFLGELIKLDKSELNEV